MSFKAFSSSLCVNLYHFLQNRLLSIYIKVHLLFHRPLKIPFWKRSPKHPILVFFCSPFIGGLSSYTSHATYSFYLPLLQHSTLDSYFTLKCHKLVLPQLLYCSHQAVSQYHHTTANQGKRCGVPSCSEGSHKHFTVLNGGLFQWLPDECLYTKLETITLTFD